jgi:uncharacterized protein YecE (DUF72 family)
MRKILVGTASWTDKTLLDSGLFYPAKAKSAEERLKYYASKFPITEVDSSFYALPSERNAEMWAERTPARFAFHVKAFRLFTGHQTGPSALPKDIREALGTKKKNVYYKDMPTELQDELWERFGSALRPLQRAGKLAAVLLQFPRWFFPSRESYAHIVSCAERLSESSVRCSVEFRSASWFRGDRRDRVLAFLREHDLVNVIVDEPQGFSSSIPAVWEATSPGLALVRFHGRNAETWEKKGLDSAALRFNYLYSKTELRDLAASVKSVSENVEEAHVLFNNCYRDYGQRNAMDFQRLLD